MDILDPIQLGRYRLNNRVVMAPLTRSRAHADGAPRIPLMAIYYGQRATAGLIVSEATNISPQGRGYAFTPGLYNDAQVRGWQIVTEDVHAKGGRIFAQLWHVGRISHPSLQPGGALPVAPSPLKPDVQAFTEIGYQPCVTPRPLLTDEISVVIEQYRHAARMALAAGFDGVEVHAANGYLLEQFLRDSTNLRDDRYGGSLHNRVRLTLEVMEAVTSECGSDRVGIRLSPVSPANDCGQDADPQRTYEYVANELNAFEPAYVHVIEGATQGSRDNVPFDYVALRRRFRGFYIANNGYDLNMAWAALHRGGADLVSFGRPYIANPDLVERFRLGLPLSRPDPTTFFGGDERGYTDYPFLPHAKHSEAQPAAKAARSGRD